MPIPAIRTLEIETVRNFGTIEGGIDLHDLTRIQTDSFAQFGQRDRASRDRKDQGLEAILREIFPIETVV